MLVAGAAAIAVVLILRKDYVLGALIGAMAVLRLGLLLATRRRRVLGRGAARRPAGSPGGRAPGNAGGFLSALARSEFLVAAGVIGMDPMQMRQSYDQGMTLAEMAAGMGVPLDRVLGAIVSDASVKIDDAVARGTIPQRRAAFFKSRLPVWAGRLVNHRKRELQAAK